MPGCEHCKKCLRRNDLSYILNTVELRPSDLLLGDEGPLTAKSYDGFSFFVGFLAVSADGCLQPFRVVTGRNPSYS